MESVKIDKDAINSIGKKLAESLSGYFGSVRFNIQGGRYVNANLETSIKPESNQERK